MIINSTLILTFGTTTTQQQQQLAEMAELPGLGKHCNFKHCKQLGKWFI